MAKQLYPRPKKPKKDRSGLRYEIKYNLLYDGGYVRKSGYYSTYIQARLAAFWFVQMHSWGGSAILIDTRKEGWSKHE